jgi:dihydroneopterin aldolase
MTKDPFQQKACPSLLASVTSVAEAQIALAGGADIIDLKNPEQGALGALPLSAIREIVESVGRRKPLSATVGDLPMQPQKLADAVINTAATGVDIVKIGFFGRTGHAECIRAMLPLTAQGIAVVAVLFADDAPDFGVLMQMAHAGLHGVMLDTATKNGKRLRHHLDDEILQQFVEHAGSLGLLTGLAGSLAVADIPVLAKIGPDYLGFRGALCQGSDRKASLDPLKLREVSDVLHSCNMNAKSLPELA